MKVSVQGQLNPRAPKAVARQNTVMEIQPGSKPKERGRPIFLLEAHPHRTNFLFLNIPHLPISSVMINLVDLIGSGMI